MNIITEKMKIMGRIEVDKENIQALINTGYTDNEICKYRFSKYLCKTLDGYYVSLNVGQGAFSTPNKEVELEEYTHIELCFIKPVYSLFGIIINQEVERISNIEFFNKFDKIKEIEKYYNDDKKIECYQYVPIELIEDLYNYTKNYIDNYGLNIDKYRLK